MSRQLTNQEQQTLLGLARSAIEAELSGGESPRPANVTEALDRLCGAFVTLTIDGELRGCIGHVVAFQPLWQSVRDNAVAAAVRDPRFPAVSASELGSIEIEVSALTPLVPVDDIDEIEVAISGTILSSDC